MVKTTGFKFSIYGALTRSVGIFKHVYRQILATFGNSYHSVYICLVV